MLNENFTVSIEVQLFSIVYTSECCMKTIKIHQRLHQPFFQNLNQSRSLACSSHFLCLSSRSRSDYNQNKSGFSTTHHRNNVSRERWIFTVKSREHEFIMEQTHSCRHPFKRKPWQWDEWCFKTTTYKFKRENVWFQLIIYLNFNLFLFSFLVAFEWFLCADYRWVFGANDNQRAEDLRTSLSRKSKLDIY